ncbi:MAG TPA: STN domain-containing protein [Candidatus Acidoferrum sp.]|nr:STN domain-containing protein [Candidatus Acidoferrum sp.]
MKTMRSILRNAWAQLARARRLPPGNPARSGARLLRALLAGITALFLAQAALWPVPATGAENGEQMLDAARAALHGRDKDTGKAKKLLLEILKQDKATLQPGSLCYVYVYLGYIEDLATNRTQAVAWYKKALALKDCDLILGCAQQGLKEPMTWIRHLDEDAAPARRAGSPAASPNAAPADARLQEKVKFEATQASVQDIVRDLARQVGLGYEWKKSFAQTDPLCRRWVNNVAIEGKPCREALDQILDPVGLRYAIEQGSIVLYRK